MRRTVFYSCRLAIALIFSHRERCSLDPCSGFEVFVPGRQGMAPASNPVFRSANLIRRTVSHLFHRAEEEITLVIVRPFPPNQSLQPTAGRSGPTLRS
jgi:hypothetical protein